MELLRVNDKNDMIKKNIEAVNVSCIFMMVPCLLKTVFHN